MARPSIDELLMDQAWSWAQRGTCDRLQVGAVLSRDGRVLSTGYNGAPAGHPHCFHSISEHMVEQPCDRAIHAEANAIVWAARAGIGTLGTTLYTTHSPCPTCCGLIINAGIQEVVYSKAYRNRSGLAVLELSDLLVRRI